MSTPTTASVDREQVRAVIAELLMPGGLPAKPAVLSRVTFVQAGKIRADAASTEPLQRLAKLTAHVGQLAVLATHGDDYRVSEELAQIAAIALAWLDQLDIGMEEPPF